MGGFWQWWDALTASQQVPIINTLLDKGLLALIVALAGYIFSRSLERHKAYLVRYNEFEKFNIPRVASLIEDLENLLKLGRKIRKDFDEELEKIWTPWLAGLLDIHISFDEAKFWSPQNATLSTTIKGGDSLGELLAKVLNDKTRKQAIANLPPEYNDDFVRNLATFYWTPADSPLRDSLKKSVHLMFYLQFFPKVTPEQRTKFKTEADKFLQKAGIVLAADRQNIIPAIIQSQEGMVEAIQAHPNPYDSADLFYTSYFAIASQLLRALRPTS
ncbi:hypothetical protein [Rhizobium jaguaris]|uniref:Uncharacterized protein n=1 Tax=Rhizobium jaguaris TaxID=1312183 RepID=A0A387FRC9_9HYPH|nr:hypothetical protein [Rhizobium jaguaris]AYG57812.1 hypothetical protein CCGE525_02555 [Rhizobium jaguaris]